MSDTQPPSAAPTKNWLDRLIHLFGAEPQNRQELVDVIQDAEERQLIDADTREMIKGVLGVSDLRVRDLMVPRSHMIAIEKNQPVECFLPLVLESAHSRFPVFDKDKDHIEGILLAKDLLSYGFGNDSDLSLNDILRPAVVVPESKRVDVLLKEFRSDRYHMAIVVDEYGGVSGLITIEDILEAIVGDIEDETDLEDDTIVHIRKVSRHVWSVAALTPIDEFNAHFKAYLSDDEYDTVGGLISHAFGHLPQRGETISIGQFEFKVASADPRKLIQLHVREGDIPEQRSDPSAV